MAGGTRRSNRKRQNQEPPPTQDEENNNQSSSTSSAKAKKRSQPASRTDSEQEQSTSKSAGASKKRKGRGAHSSKAKKEQGATQPSPQPAFIALSCPEPCLLSFSGVPTIKYFQKYSKNFTALREYEQNYAPSLVVPLKKQAETQAVKIHDHKRTSGDVKYKDTTFHTLERPGRPFPHAGLCSWIQSFKEERSYVRNARVMSMEWNPHQPHCLALGNKANAIAYWDTTKEDFPEEVPMQEDRAWVLLKTSRTGAILADNLRAKSPILIKFDIQQGVVIGSIRWDPQERGRIYVASMDGMIYRRDLETGQTSELISTDTDYAHKVWWVSADVSSLHRVVLCGNTKGFVTAVTPDSAEQLWTVQFHKSKIHHLEFSKAQPYLIATTSLGPECSVKLWDIRKISAQAKPQPLISLPHSCGVNIATFSNTGSDRLLTGDQYAECRVYQGPSWHLLSSFHHPHRQFQHLTAIRPSWHPLADLGVIGRYPFGERGRRTIDFFDGESGREVVRLGQAGGVKAKIASISKFNPTGDTLVTISASTVSLWRPREGERSGEWEMGAGVREDSDDEDSKPKTLKFTTGKKKKTFCHHPEPRALPRNKKF